MVFLKEEEQSKITLVPQDVTDEDLHGFDQGLGRRLWYISKGEVSVLTKLIHPFHSLRQYDLWRELASPSVMLVEVIKRGLNNC